MAKILIVDDDVTLLRCIAEYLEERYFEVGRTSNGADVMRLVFQERPDLVLLDVVMPNMDGWAVTTRLREVSDVPVILLSGKTSEADKLRGYKLGVDDYITKPFSFAELTARIEAVLKRTQRSKSESSNGPSTVLIGDVTLDLKKHNAFRGDELIPLAPTELRLLTVLVQHHGDAVEENTLIKEVWGDFRQEETAAVRRYIWMLRQKIEKDPSDPQLILTVRGFGYRVNLGAVPASI
jgi:two-component system KDP operon response regulator KdpE